MSPQRSSKCAEIRFFFLFYLPLVWTSICSLHTVVINNCNSMFATAKHTPRHSVVAEASNLTWDFAVDGRGDCQGQVGKNNNTELTTLNSYQSPLTPSLGPSPPPCRFVPRLPGAARLHAVTALPTHTHAHAHAHPHALAKNLLQWILILTMPVINWSFLFFF